MYNMIKEVIHARGYNLTEMTNRIEKRCIENKISEEERDELLALANQNAMPENEKATLQRQIEAIFENMLEMAAEIKSLKERLSKVEGGEVVSPEELEEEYPKWQKWDGIGAIPWQNGSKCFHNGKNYVSQVNNNIWEPGAPGVYETIWKEVE